MIYRDLKKEVWVSVIACILLSCFLIGWYGFLNQYVCIFYREQSQLFLYDGDYFLQYLRMPGGFTGYIASFLIQFFRFRWAGALIYLCFFFGFYVVTKAIYKRFSVFIQSFFVPFIPGLLFLPASTNMLFDPADELGVIVALCGFIALTKLTKNKYYFLLIPLLVIALYVFVGGNIFLTLALFTLNTLSRRPTKPLSRQAAKPISAKSSNLLDKLPTKNLKYLITCLLSLLIPLIIWYFFYIISFEDACVALTPFRYPGNTLLDARSIAWLSVLILPVVGMILRKFKTGKKWSFILNGCLALIVLTLIVKQFKSDSENNVKMGFDAEYHRWEDIIVTGKKTSINHLSCYYINIALQQTGQMAEKMFCYNQIGTQGLFPPLKDHFSCFARSEVFYQLGWINPAQHSVYESLSGYTFIKEPNIRNVKRLYDCAIIQQNDVLAKKYKKMMNRSLFYRNFDNKLPSPLFATTNMLIHNIPDALETLMEDNSTNQAVFEYLMAWYLLEREFEKAKNTFDRYFTSFSYAHIPTHYAEFLLLYKRLNKLDDSFYEQYPISRELQERFEIMDILVQSRIDITIQKTLEDSFKHTYWYYVRFPFVQVQKTVKDEKNIY